MPATPAFWKAATNTFRFACVSGEKSLMAASRPSRGSLGATERTWARPPATVYWNPPSVHASGLAKARSALPRQVVSLSSWYFS